VSLGRRHALQISQDKSECDQAGPDRWGAVGAVGGRGVSRRCTGHVTPS